MYESITRLTTGVPGLDEALGGGLIAGTLTVVVGATGIGKTQFGIQFAHAGHAQEGRRGIVFDVSARGDSQSHQQYARSLFDWNLQPAEVPQLPDLTGIYDNDFSLGEYLRIFEYQGRRVTRTDLDFDQWHDWQAQLNARLSTAIAFLYGHFVRNVRRIVVDGIEPVDRAAESVQLELFEYVYHQILRKDPEWVARDLFRQQYRSIQDIAAQGHYRPDHIGCLLLCTSREKMLDELVARPLEEGDVLGNANTLVYMGKVRNGQRLANALYIAKHRGSACSDEILPYRITDDGLRIDS